LTGQPTQTYYKLHERAAKAEQVMSKLRALNLGNHKRK